MSKSRGKQNSAANSRPRDEMGRFESTETGPAKSSSNKSAEHKSRSEAAADRCRNEQGRFESCDNKSDSESWK